MTSFYAPDDLVRQVMNSNSCSVQHVYTEEEAAERFNSAKSEFNLIVKMLVAVFSMRGYVHFAMVASSKSYQVTYVVNDTFVLLIDYNAFYNLCTLCLRTQSLPPLAEAFGFKAALLEREYRGQCLIDILRDFIFRTEELSCLLLHDHSRIAFQAANTFILGHEAAHIAHGHLEFCASIDFSAFAVDEDDRNLTFRTLEMDADSSATTSVISIFELLIDKAIGSGSLPSNLTPLEYQVSVRKQYILGMYLALLFLDALSTSYQPIKHPIGYARFLTTVRVAQKAFGRISLVSVFLPELMREKLVEPFAMLSGDIGALGHPIASNVEALEVQSNRKLHLYHEA